MPRRSRYLLFALIAFAGPFVIAESAARFFAAPGSYDYIEKRLMEQDFHPRKKKGEFRIFLYGESTMHGSHLSPNSTIGIWLKLYLENLLGPEAARNVTVTNLARLGVNSHFIKQSFLDTVVYKPDLAVFYTAHNDMALRDDKWDILDKSFSRRAGLFCGNLIKKSALISAFRRAAVRRRMRRAAREKKKGPPAEKWFDHTNRRLYHDEKDQLDPDSAGAREIVRLWQENIRTIIRTARRRRIPVIFFKGLARYDAFEPYASVHRPDMTDAQRSEWETADRRAEKDFRAGDYEKALSGYRRCRDIDPRYALTYFRMGVCYERLGNFSMARRSYVEANDRDFTPIRGPSSLGRFYDSLKKENLPGVYVIPTQEIFEGLSPNGMVDSRLVADQLHPTVRGQAVMALEICRVLYENNLLGDKDRWHWDRLEDFETSRDKLDINEEFRFRTLLWSANYVGSYYDKAVDFLMEALQIKPRSLTARSQLAWIYWKTGRRREAAAIYDELIKEFPKQAAAFFARYPEFYPEAPIGEKQ